MFPLKAWEMTSLPIKNYLIREGVASESVGSSGGPVTQANSDGSPDSQSPRLEDDQAALKRDIFQSRERHCDLPSEFTGSHHRRKLNQGDAKMGAEGKSEQIAEICVARDQDSLPLLRGLEYLTIRRTTQVEVTDVLARMSSFQKETGQQVRQVFVDKEARH